MFGLDSPMKMLLCLLDKECVIQPFALQLCQFEQVKYVIVIRMSIYQFNQYMVRVAQVDKDIMKSREITSHLILNCLLRF